MGGLCLNTPSVICSFQGSRKAVSWNPFCLQKVSLSRISKPALFLDWPSCIFEITQTIVKVSHRLRDHPFSQFLSENAKIWKHQGCICISTWASPLCHRLLCSELNIGRLITLQGPSFIQLFYRLAIKLNTSSLYQLHLRFYSISHVVAVPEICHVSKNRGRRKADFSSPETDQ